MNLKIIPPEILHLPPEVIEKALKQAADEALNQAMAQNWDRQRFWYWLPVQTVRFGLRPSVMTEGPGKEVECD